MRKKQAVKYRKNIFSGGVHETKNSMTSMIISRKSTIVNMFHVIKVLNFYYARVCPIRRLLGEGCPAVKNGDFQEKTAGD